MKTDNGNVVAADEASRQPEQPECVRKCRKSKWRCFLRALLFVVIVGGGTLYWAFFLRIYNLDVCQSAMRAIQADKQAQEALGQPITTVKWPSRLNTPSARVEDRETDIRWKIEGPKGRAEAHVTARLMQGKWETVLLEVTLPGNKKLSIREAGGGENDAPAFGTATKSDEKKSETNAPPPQIDLPLPPGEPAPAGK